MKSVRFALVLFALLCGLGLVVLWSGVLTAPLLRAASAEIEARTGYKLEVNGGTRIALLPSPGLVAEDVRLVSPTEREPPLRIERVSVALSLGELLSRRIHATEVALRAPVFRFTSGLPQAGPARKTSPDASWPGLTFEKLTVENGTFVLRDAAENVEFKLDGLGVKATSAAGDGPLELEARGNWGATPLALQGKIGSPSRLLDGTGTPVELALRQGASGPSLFSSKGQMKGDARSLALENLDGTLGRGRVRGAATLDWSRPKPYLAADVSGEGIRIAWPFAAGPNARQPWSSQPLDLSALRLFNAAVKLAARELLVENVKVAAAQVDASVLDGVLSVGMAEAMLYGGKAQGRLVVDASKPEGPTQSLRLSLTDMEALPLFTDAFGLENVDGRVQAHAMLQAKGPTPAAIAAALDGTAKVTFENGAIQGLGLENAIRTLPTGLVQGWALSTPERIPFGTFGMTFSIVGGRATTEDLALSGPYLRANGKGTADIGSKTLDFTVEPTVVFPDAQGRAGRSVRLGIPILIQGAWNDPKVSAPVERLLQNPEGAIRTLQSLGEGLLSGTVGPKAPGEPQRRGERDSGPAPGGGLGQVQDIIKNLFGN